MNLTIRPSRIFNLGWIIFATPWFISLGVFGPDKQTGTAHIYFLSIFLAALSIRGFLTLQASLDLDEEGFTVRARFRSRHYRWSEVKAFVIGRAGISSGRVVFNLSDVDRDKLGRGSLWKRFINDHDAILPLRFGLSGQELAETMNQWRWRSILTDRPPAHAVNANQNSDASSASGSRRGENRSRGRDRRRANCLHAIPYKSSLFLLDYLASFGNFAKHCVGRSGFVSALSILHGVVRGPSPQRLRTLVGDAEKWLHLSKAKIESPLFSSSFWLRLCNSPSNTMLQKRLRRPSGRHDLRIAWLALAVSRKSWSGRGLPG